jgi:lysophospholipase L1-like esterase
MSWFTRTEPAAGRSSRVSAGRVRRRPVWLFPAATLLLIGAGQEIVFREMFVIPEVKGFNRISYQMTAQSHHELGGMMSRGLVYDRLLVESRPDGFSEIHDLNVYGFRGPDFAIEPDAGRRRILLIGDSMTEGIGAPESATIARELERRLTADGERVEVINLGVIAATLGHVTALARDAVSLLRPADVVVVLFANDLPAPRYDPAFDRHIAGFERSKVAWWMPRLATLVGRYIHDEPIYRRWFHAPIRFFAPVPDSVNPWTGSTGPPEALEPALYQEMRAGRLNPWLHAQAKELPGMLGHDFAKGGSPDLHLTRLADDCRAAGARMTVAYIPFCGVVSRRYVPAQVRLGMDRETAEALPVDPVYRRQNAILADVCGALKFPLADATDDLVAAEAAGVPQFWDLDAHPRPAGYATIAGRIHRTLRRDSHERRSDGSPSTHHTSTPARATSTPAKYQAAQTRT